MATEFYNRNWRMPNSWNGSTDNNNKVSNYSMEFDGSSEYIDLTQHDLGTTNTISLWLNISSITSAQTVLGEPSNAFKQSVIIASNIIYIKDVSNHFKGWNLSTSSEFSLNNWHHFGIVRSGSTVTFYIDGVDQGSPDSSSGAFTANTKFRYLGTNYPSNSQFVNGKIDHLAIFDYALSSSQITSLYGSSSTGVGNPMAITGGRKPVAYYPIGDYAAFNGSEYLVNNGALQDYVFDFTNSLQYIDLNTTLTDLSVTDTFSFSIWVKADSVNPWANAIGADADGSWSAGFGLFIRSNKWSFWVDKWDQKFADHTPAIEVGKWYHIVCTYSDSSGGKMYVNNASPDTFTATTLDGQDININIGTINGGASYDFPGKITNTQIWNAELTSSEVTTLYNNGTPYMGTQPQSSNLQGWWKLDASATFDGSNWSIPDSSSNSNTGTSSGMTAANLVQSNLNITTPYSRYALDFDGTSDQIVTGITNTGTDVNVSLSCWINTTTNIASRQSPFGGVNNATAGSNSYSLGVVSPSGTSTRVRAFNTLGSTTLNDGNWHNIIYTYEYSTKDVKIYVDGNTTPEVSVTFPNYLTTYQILIGGFSLGGMFFSGSISNCSLWNNVLTSSQVTEIYNQRKPSNLNNHSAYSNLVSWWQLGENMSYDSNVWTVLDEKGTNNGTGQNLAPAEDSIVNGVGTSANGLSDGMGGADNIIGEAPYSTVNAVSYGMGVDALVNLTP